MSACVEDYKTVLSLWGPVEANPKYYGEIIFQRLFETHPDAQKLFPKFAGLSKEQLENNPDFQAHGEIAVSTLTEFVQHQKADQSFVKELAQRREVWFQKMNFSIFSEIIVMVAAEKIDGFGTDAQTALKNVLKAFQTAMGA
ncbi:myoglobin-like [Polypterus senegalus]|uniref:myoglobin-like n=1 Tax=Polypterus senegalus TaxID=55291 RepID=UPI00196460B3|nr:myoglobin-like [Polypterus senegalus]